MAAQPIEHTSAPAPTHHTDTWIPLQGQAYTSDPTEVTCLACLEKLHEENTVTCNHQETRDTWWVPGEYCEQTALPGSDYCKNHAAAHGDHMVLAQWETAI